MTIGIDYLARTGLIKEFLTTPCSFFVKDINNQNYAFNIEKKKNNFIVKKWLFDQSNSLQVLPPFEEFSTLDVFLDEKIISSNYSLLKFLHKGIPSCENLSNRPMSNEKFTCYFDNYMMNFSIHNIIKERYLWSIFINIFHPDLSDYGNVILNLFESTNKSIIKNEIFYDQQRIIMENYPKSYKSWNIWKKNILILNGVPGELIFKSCFKCYFEN